MLNPHDQSPQERAAPGEEDAQWYCFDDTSVEPWDISNLERDCFGGKYRPAEAFPGAKPQVDSGLSAWNQNT